MCVALRLQSHDWRSILCAAFAQRGIAEWFASVDSIAFAEHYRLAIGHCAHLRWKANHIRHAFDFMSSEPVQSQLRVLCEMGDASTLDIERKHCLDKRTEARRLSSCGKASRDGIIRQWRTHASHVATVKKQDFLSFRCDLQFAQ